MKLIILGTLAIIAGLALWWGHHQDKQDTIDGAKNESKN